MPPPPRGAIISNGPSLLPGARGIVGCNYTFGNPVSENSGPEAVAPSQTVRVGNSHGKSQMVSKLEIARGRSSEARGTRSSGTHFRGVDSEAEMGEIGLAEGHKPGV